MEKIFATLCGTDYGNTEYLKVYAELLEIAYSKGFIESNENQRPRPNQTSLNRWSLWLKGSRFDQCVFMLSVTAPQIPLIAPVPITIEIDVPLFAVVVNKDFYLISNERDILETKNIEKIKNEFLKFLEKFSIAKS